MEDPFWTLSFLYCGSNRVRVEVGEDGGAAPLAKVTFSEKSELHKSGERVRPVTARVH